MESYVKFPVLVSLGTPANITVNDFDNALAKPLHNDITVPMREYLHANNYISN